MDTNKLDATEARTVEACNLEADFFFEIDPPGMAGTDLRFAFSLLQPNPLVLDIGCGYGRVIPHLEQVADFRYVGIDPSPEMLRIGKREFPQRDFQLLNLYQLPEQFPEGHFDLAIAITTMAYITPPRRPEALACIRKVIKRGGVGYFTFFTDDYALCVHRNKPVPTNFPKPFSTLYGWSKMRSEPQLQMAGFLPVCGFDYTGSGMYSIVAKAI